VSEIMAFSTDKIEGLARAIELVLDTENPAPLIGADLTNLVARIPSEQQVTPGAVVRLSLLNDTLCIAERAIKVDGQISPAEVHYVTPLVGEAQKYLGRFRHVYRDVDATGPQGIRHFLEQHTSDGQKFGGRCKSTAWIGLNLCKRAAELTGDQQYVDDYRDLLVRLLDDLFNDVGSGTSADKDAVVHELHRLAPPVTPARDPREVAYCSTSSAEVFHAVAHGAEVFTPDLFDVEQIHSEARTAFSRVLEHANGARFGKLLLIKGVAGSGKTHLMRAFRNQVHGEHLGFVAYMQMSTRVANYARYILSNLIDSWDRPFWGDVIPEPAILCLSDSLARDLPKSQLAVLRDDELPDTELDAVVNRAADLLIALPRYKDVHTDVLRTLLYLQRRDPARRARVLKFLRCEPLNAYDRQLLGDTAAFEDEHAAARMLTELGRLVSITGNGALVLLVDQLEDIYHLDEASTRFCLAMDALRHVADHVPTAVIVVACLDDFYVALRRHLSGPMLDRLERDPDPVQLTASRSRADIEELIKPRLALLFERQNVLVRPDQPLYPFTPGELDALVNERTRLVLDWCRSHHESSIRAGVIRPPAIGASLPAPPDEERLGLEQAWNDHLAASSETPKNEAEMVALIAWTLETVARERPGTAAPRPRLEGTTVEAQWSSSKLVLGLCEKLPQAGGLGRQVDAVVRRAAELGALPIVLRSSEYPRPGKNQITERLKAVLAAGGRRVLVTDAEWRYWKALQTFLKAYEQQGGVDRWLESAKPLSSNSVLREILALDEPFVAEVVSQATPSQRARPRTLPPTAAPPTTGEKPAHDTPRPASAAGAIPKSAPTDFAIGHTRALTPQPVRAAAGSFVTHAAFLGSTKSGKTTLALNIIEQLLERGVPVLMLDRKGDLCRYADAGFWQGGAEDAALAARKAALRERLDVCVFTPGEPKGRGLKLPVIPTGLDQLPAHDRGIIARHAASALGAMIGYGKSQADQARLGILGKAIELLGQTAGAAQLGIGQLVSLLDDEDPDLVASIGKLDPRHFRALVESLETLRLRYVHLLESGGDVLSPELLFGRGAHQKPGRTRLSIISTKFIGDNAAIDFWVARLLGELGRWASRSPSDALQAVVFLDEADIYLPAQSKPATKEPVMDLLKRGRSAGVGVLLATQSPGDLDYKCRDNIRTWFVGRVAQKPAVDKMKPLLSECRINVSAKLAQAKTGEFFRLQDGDVTELRADLAVMKTEQMTEDAILAVAEASARS
jgi:hypothetical protein